MISVVICTYNRAALLAQVLQSVCEQTLAPSEYEVIVIDNNSTDDTAAVCDSFAVRYPHVRSCFEAKQGASNARNRGWHEAKGAYVAYIDDDCKVPPAWLAVAQAIIDAEAPAIFGGPALAFYTSPKPYWFRDAYDSYVQLSEAGPLPPDQYLVATNMFFEKALLHQIGGFDPTLGPSGGQLAYGEESAVLRFVRTHLPDAHLYADPQLYVYHLTHPQKMTWRWILRDRFIRGRYEYRVYLADQASRMGRAGLILKAGALIAVFGLDVMRGLLLRNRARYPYFQNYLYESSLRYLTALGRTYEQYRHLADRKHAGKAEKKPVDGASPAHLTN